MRQHCLAILANVRQILRALSAARIGVRAGQMHLRKLAACIRAAERSGPPTVEPDPEQKHVDQLLAAMDSIATNSTHDGRPLLDGSWSVNLCEVGSQTHRTLNLPCLMTDHLGADSSGAALAALSTGGRLALARRDSRRSLGVIERASRALNRALADIDSFLADVVEPLQAALSVALENATSSITAHADMSLAAELGRLTRGDALIAATARRPPPTDDRAALRLARGPRPTAPRQA